MSAVPITVGIPQNFHVKAMSGSTEIPVTTQMVFTSSDTTKATVAATGLQDCRVTPVGGNADGTPATVTISSNLPGNSQYSSFDGSQDALVVQIQINALAFVAL